MQELHFNVFGALVAIRAVAGGWAAFRLGPDGKRRPAEFVVPEFIAEEELCQYLADLFHEHASPTNGDVVRIGGSDSISLPLDYVRPVRT